MRPQPAEIIPPRNARVTRYGATASTRTVATHSAGSVSLISWIGPNTPAALTTMLGAPSVSSTRWRIRSTAPASLTSVGTATACPPAATISSTAVATPCPERATTATGGPRPRAATAMSRPSPLLAPVTPATRDSAPVMSSPSALAGSGAQVEDLAELRGGDDAVVAELHQRVHHLAPSVVDLAVPQPVP